MDSFANIKELSAYLGNPWFQSLGDRHPFAGSDSRPSLDPAVYPVAISSQNRN